MKKQNQKRMDYWQDRVERAKTAWEGQRKKMDQRESIYRGRHSLDKLVEGDKKSSIL